MGKVQRHMRIREIIKQSKLCNQEEIVKELIKLGINTTQATVSRDIKELQLVKTASATGEYYYALPIESFFNPEQKLKRALQDSFISLAKAENQVVIKCLPGHANALGAVIDSLEWAEIVGTISGDDTILIIAQSKKAALLVENNFMRYI